MFLSDFGVVKALDEDLSDTAAGTGIGSPRYMAPEQGVGRAVGGAADQYGLATAVYEALTGRLPFAGETALEVLLAKHKEAPTPLHELAPELPAPCADAVMRALSTDPADRYATCQEFADAFLTGAGIFDRTPSSGVPTVAGERLDAPPPRRRLHAALLVTALFALGMVALGAAAGWFSPAGEPQGEGAGDANAARIVLLSNGAEPRRALRYRPSVEAAESIGIHVVTEEATLFKKEDPPHTTVVDITMQLDLEVAGIAANGDISYAWRVPEFTLGAAETLPEAAREAIHAMAGRMEGRSGTARQSDRGVQRDLQHDTPPPENGILLSLFGLVVEFAQQPSTPLPEEAVGVGARWEITTTKEHVEGIRITQIVTYEIESLDDEGAHLRMYIAVTAPNQAFEHPSIPAEVQARLKQVTGNGEGEVEIDFARMGDPQLWMTIASQTKFSMSESGEQQEVSTERRVRVDVKRK